MSYPSPLELVLDPASVLHHRSAPVKTFDAQLRQLVSEMYQRCVEWNGVGLAAPQVGLNLQLAVVVYEGRRFALCNPQQVSGEGEVDGEEGCLSLPNQLGMVRRCERITVRYRNVQGRGVVRSFDGWLARIVQHESDHLLGVLCKERLAPGATFAPAPSEEEKTAEEGRPRRRSPARSQPSETVSAPPG